MAEKKDPVARFAEETGVPKEVIERIVNIVRSRIPDVDPNAAVRGYIRYGSIDSIPVSGIYTWSYDAEKLRRIIEQGWKIEELKITARKIENANAVFVRVEAPNGLYAEFRVEFDIPDERDLNKNEWLLYQSIRRLAEKIAEGA